jgi:hypothetical protein
VKKSTNGVILSREDGEGSQNATTEAAGAGRRILRSFAALRMTGLVDFFTASEARSIKRGQAGIACPPRDAAVLIAYLLLLMS